MAKVNLDAIIPREDFEVEENVTPGKKKETLSIEDIKSDSFFFSNVRKPDFQRETNEWDSKKIADFIESFLDGDLIPAIILWRSTGGYLFVIDGSHRLSSLAAWINDDYGDGTISKQFYDGIIPEEQIATCDTCTLCRSPQSPYINTKCCTYQPTLVNFLLGGVFVDDDTSLAIGKERIQSQIKSRAGVTPYGIIPSNAYVQREKQANTHDFWSRPHQLVESIRCPYSHKGLCTHGDDPRNIQSWHWRGELPEHPDAHASRN